MQEFELKCVQLISEAGVAKSNYIEAIAAVKKGNHRRVTELIREGEKSFIQGHNTHMELLQMTDRIDTINYMLLLMHAEDQLMSAEMYKTLFHDFESLYKKIQELEEVIMK